jgi:hypothetical protein
MSVEILSTTELHALETCGIKLVGGFAHHVMGTTTPTTNAAQDVVDMA